MISLFRRVTPAPDWSGLLDSLSDVVAMFSAGGRIEYLNRAWQQTLGHPLANSLGDPFHRYLHPEDSSRWQQALMQYQSDPEAPPQTLWLRLIRHDQEVCWCEMRLQAMPDEARLSATLCDITGQVHNNRQRDASHRSLNSLIERLPVMIYRSRNDRDWTMEYLSQGCLALTGYSAEEILQRNQHVYGHMIHPADSDRVWQEVQDALKKHHSFELQYRLFHQDGSLRTVIDKGCGVYTSSGAILAVEGVIFALENR